MAVAHTFDSSAFSSKLKEVERRDPEYIQFGVEFRRQANIYGKLFQEGSELVIQKRDSADEEERKMIQQKLELVELERDMALAMRNKAINQQNKRSSEIERELLLKELKLALHFKYEVQRRLEAKAQWITKCKELAKKWQKEADTYAEKLRILKKEGVQESNIEGYLCVGHSALGFVYIPDTTKVHSVDIQYVDDNSMHPKRSTNEVALTSVVSITCQHEMLFEDKPAIIELLKIVELSDYDIEKIITMFNSNDDSIPPNWRNLEEKCEMLGDRVRFKTSHFSKFAAIAIFSSPTASMDVDPDTDGQVKMTVPELPGFSVTIPANSVQSPTQVKATLHCDDQSMCKESANYQLASACVRLEPESQKFAENVSVCLPIPGYTKIITTNPNANLQLMHSPTSTSNDWEIHKNMEIDEVGGYAVAKFSTDRFGSWKLTWENAHGVPKAIGTLFKHVTHLHCRCQVFMSREIEVGSKLKLHALVVVYPFQDPPRRIPCNYDYILHDSGISAIMLTPGKLHFSMELREPFLPEKTDESLQCFEKNCQLYLDVSALVEFSFDVDLNSKGHLVEGAVFGCLSIEDSSTEYKLDLIKTALKEESTVTVPPSSISQVQIVYLPSVTGIGQLCNDNLKDVVAYLWPVRLMWRQIGVAFGIDPSILDLIEEDHCRADDCLSAMILIWLQCGKDIPCWKQLAKALSLCAAVKVISEEDGNEYTENLKAMEDETKAKPLGEDFAENSSNIIKKDLSCDGNTESGISSMTDPEKGKAESSASTLADTEVKQYDISSQPIDTTRILKGEEDDDKCTGNLKSMEDDTKAKPFSEDSAKNSSNEVEKDLSCDGNTGICTSSMMKSEKGKAESSASPLADTEVKQYDIAGYTKSKDSCISEVTSEARDDVTEAFPAIPSGRQISHSQWLFLSLLPLSGFLAIGLIWFLRRWRK